MNALEEGVIVKLSDAAGNSLWDATVHNNGLCSQMISHMASNMASRYPNWKGAYTESRYPVRNGLADAGFVTVGYYGPFFFDDSDLAFINALNRLLIWAACISLAFAVVVGLLMARGIGVPLSRVAAAAGRIGAGDLAVALPEKSGIREIDGISASMNSLSRSLSSQEALRKRLTADMAHEIRTPLATLQSHIEALIDGVWQPDRGRLEGLHGEILRVARMVSDLESLARYDSQSLGLERTDTDLSALVMKIVKNHEPQFQAKGVALISRAAAGPIRAYVDPDRTSQVVVNLLSNALEFTPAGGSVEVSVQINGGDAAIRVSDTGCGIGPEDLPHIFERFYRADPSRSRSTGGSGIGLAITKAIVDAHGGAITAESGPGKGSVFTVEFLRTGRGA
jgi:signal transduction histidine kinase